MTVWSIRVYIPSFSYKSDSQLVVSPTLNCIELSSLTAEASDGKVPMAVVMHQFLCAPSPRRLTLSSTF